MISSNAAFINDLYSSLWLMFLFSSNIFAEFAIPVPAPESKLPE